MNNRGMRIVAGVIHLTGFLSLGLAGGLITWGDPGEFPKDGFMKLFWYEPGIEHGNPFFNSRFRINSPEAVLHPEFMNRGEARGNGMMQILMEENLGHLAGASLYLEIWGGHPGTADKRVTINGRTTYPLWGPRTVIVPICIPSSPCGSLIWSTATTRFNSPAGRGHPSGGISSWTTPA